MKSKYLLSCACAAIIGGTAHAQTAPAPTQVADAGAVSSNDIIVTATRRNESIQKVPLTIQAFTGETLKELNVANFNDLVKFTPNVTFGNNGPGTGAIFMRGLSQGYSGSQSSSTTGTFPNVALYLDDQSMQFPARNADIYVADLERIEVLEGPQGTLFGGGAEAGAVRYITNKPKLDKFAGHFEGSAGGTVGGAPNASFSAMINVPLIQDKLAVRAVIYDDHQGGYIDNVYGTYTRTKNDNYAYYLGTPTAANQSNAGQYNNASAVKKDYNPADYIGGRVEAKWQVDANWDVLVSEMYQRLHTDGTFNQEPFSPDGTVLNKLQTVTFEPSYNKDEFYNTAWTVNGEVGDFHVVYTGAYMVRHIETQQDYTNYSRNFGEYYQCVGSGTGIGTGVNGAPYCYQPNSYWHDQTRSTHMTHEARISTPTDKRIRVIGGAFYEQFRIYDDMDFDYKTIPTCTATNTPSTGCLGQVQPDLHSTVNIPGLRGPTTGFGEDTQRGYDQYAFFGSADFDILPNLTLTAGTRYYHYSEFETGSQYQTYAGGCAQVTVCAATGSGNVNIDGKNDHTIYHGFKSRASLTWHPTSASTLYGTFSQGFRPGGFNRSDKQVLPDPNSPTHANQYNIRKDYAPDTLTNWEVGFKADMLDHKVQLNLSAYYMIWKNVQLAQFDPGDGFGNTTFDLNGANFHVKGGEIQLTARPVDGLTVQGSATYNDSKQVTSPCLISTLAGSTSLGGCITDRYSKSAITDTNPLGSVPVLNPLGVIGSSLPFAPHFQGNIRGRYDWKATSGLGFWVSTGVSYTGPTESQPANFRSGETVLTSLGSFPGSTVLKYHMAGYALIDAQIGMKRDNWTASLFGENLTNSNASMFTSSAQFIKSETVVRPTTYGLKITYDY